MGPKLVRECCKTSDEWVRVDEVDIEVTRDG